MAAMMDPVDQTVPRHLKKGAARKRHPHRCYEKAAQYVLRHTENEEMSLVHGTAVVPEIPDLRYGHAWVEIGEEYVYDGTEGHFYGRGDFFSATQAIEGTRYSPSEAAVMIARTGHFGPWWRGEVSAELAQRCDPG
jgi:hypothetical protein